MRRLLAICSAVGLLCGALGCHTGRDWGCTHGRCDCEDGPLYGCHWEDCCSSNDHGYGPAPVVHVSGASQMPAEPLRAMPKEVMPKEDAK
jgi:hypothetical protein